jgi:HEPN domain-containing protein
MAISFEDWIEKAENDWKAIQILSKHKSAPHDVISFHCQQCAEKYLKGFLYKKDITFRKTHDLMELLKQVEKIETSVIFYYMI